MSEGLFQMPHTGCPPLREVPAGTVVRIDAAGIGDGTGFWASPGSILLEFFQNGLPMVLAVGTPDEVDRDPAAAGERVVRVDRRGAVLIPGLVNAHTHLDLTHIGPRAFARDEGFFGWGSMIGRERRRDEAEIAESVRQGIAMSLAGGTVAVGDIAGAVMHEDGTIRASVVPVRELRRSPLVGESYLEFFAMGSGRAAGQAGVERSLEEALREKNGSGGVVVGVQPHAPYSVDRRAYRWAIDLASRLRIPVSTHLAEHEDEREFVSRGTGPAKTFLTKIGKWDESVLDEVGRGVGPVAHLGDLLEGIVAAHVNDADDAAIEVLARTRARGKGGAVVYCPRCSAYFGHERTFGPHRYREMLAAGVNVCLGTDSIVNLPEGTARLSVLDEMRFLYERDGTDPAKLLWMGTINGATALGLDEAAFVFAPRQPGRQLAGLVAVEVELPQTVPLTLGAIFQTVAAPKLLFGGKYCTLTEIEP